VETFGAYLKRERELRGISLREVAQTTKISLHTLELLEAERFDEIGGEIFVRGFLRNSARYLGLNPEDVVLRYDEFRQQSRPEQDFSPHIDLPSLAPDRKLFLAGGGVLLLLGAILFLSRFLSTPQAKHGVASNTAIAALPAPGFPVAASAPAAVTNAALPASLPVDLKIIATATTYIKLWIDGGQPVEREMQPGAEERFGAKQKIEILAGTAGGSLWF
jgi:transcriptional regulator with XRE-family HTH domain